MKLPLAWIIALLTLLCGCERLPMAGGKRTWATPGQRAVIYANDGTRAKGASVILRSGTILAACKARPGNQTRQGKRETVTDDSGHFEIDLIGIGNYYIEVNDGESSATVIAATVSSGDESGTPFYRHLEGPMCGNLRKYRSATGTILENVCAGLNGLERKTPLDSTGRFEMRDLPSGTLSFRIVSQDTLFKPFDIDSIPLTSGKIDTVPYAGWRFARSIALNSTSSGAGVASPP